MMVGMDHMLLGNSPLFKGEKERNRNIGGHNKEGERDWKTLVQRNNDPNMTVLGDKERYWR
jgi:inorganic pyrophosphatase